jgi:hypothetical protein
MTRPISIFLFFITHFVLGQAPVNLILTWEQNEKWISEIKKAHTDRRLDFLRERILLDTNVYVKSSAPDRIKLADESQNGKKLESFCRPLIILNGQCENHYLNISNQTEIESIQLLASFLTIDNIEKIAIHTGDKAMSIYGSRAAAGVFVLVVRKKSTCRAISKIDFGTW